jgi:chromosome segregation ATPase
MTLFDGQVSSLEAKAVEQEETLSLMAGDLQQEQEHCSSLQREKTLLKDLLQKAETVKASQEAKIKQMNEMLCDMKSEKCTLLEDMDMVTGKLRDAECQLDQKANEYSQAKVQYQSAARALEDKLSILTADLHNSCERSNSLEDQLNATHMEMKDLRESLDTVHAQKMEADQFNADLQKKKITFI